MNQSENFSSNKVASNQRNYCLITTCNTNLNNEQAFQAMQLSLERYNTNQTTISLQCLNIYMYHKDLKTINGFIQVINAFQLKINVERENLFYI